MEQNALPARQADSARESSGVDEKPFQRMTQGQNERHTSEARDHSFTRQAQAILGSRLLPSEV